MADNNEINIENDINNLTSSLFEYTNVTDLPDTMNVTDNISSALGSAISDVITGGTTDADSVITKAIKEYMQNNQDTSAPTENKFLGYLEKIDNFLSNLTLYLDKLFGDITNFPQYAVDNLCEYASEWISYLLEFVTVWIVNSVSSSLEGAKYIIASNGTTAALILAIVSSIPGATTVIGLVAAVAAIGAYFKHLYDKHVKPYKQALEFVKEVTEKIISISEKLQKLARYTPPKGGDVNFDKFHIEYSMNITSMISGSGGLSYPKMPKFRKPSNPFTGITELVNEAKKNSSTENS